MIPKYGNTTAPKIREKTQNQMWDTAPGHSCLFAFLLGYGLLTFVKKGLHLFICHHGRHCFFFITLYKPLSFVNKTIYILYTKECALYFCTNDMQNVTLPKLHTPGKFPGNSRGTGRFSWFRQELVPQSVPVIQYSKLVNTVLPTVFNGERSVVTSLFEILVTGVEREREREKQRQREREIYERVLFIVNYTCFTHCRRL